jgi:hypothetical protein
VRCLAIIGILLTASPAFASEWVLVSGHDVKLISYARVSYIDVAGMQTVGSEIEVQIADVRRDDAMDGRPSAQVQRLRVDCTWEAVRIGAWRSLDPDVDNQNKNSSVASSGDTFQPLAYNMFLPGNDIIAKICDGAGDGERFSDENAMLDDAVKRLGYAGVAAAHAVAKADRSNRPPPAPYDLRFGVATGAPQTYDIVHAAPDGRAVVLARSTIQRDGSTTYGASYWMIGLDAPKDARSVAYRAFSADCASHSIAITSVSSWKDRPYKAKSNVPFAVSATAKSPPPSSPLASLLDAVCDRTPPIERLASFGKVVAHFQMPPD